MAIVGGACKLEACGAEAKAPPSMAGEVLCFRLANAVHIEAKESYGFSRVARSPGNNRRHEHRALLRRPYPDQLYHHLGGWCQGATLLYSTGYDNPEGS